jgi:ubiquitin C-terminal hydrolase
MRRDVPEPQSIPDASDQDTSPSHSRVYGPHLTNYNAQNGDDSDTDMDLFEKRPAHDLVGLKNQGATCYLNSLLQVL